MTPNQLLSQSATELASYLYNRPALALKLRTILDEVFRRLNHQKEPELPTAFQLAKGLQGSSQVASAISVGMKGVEVKEITMTQFEDFQHTLPFVYTPGEEGNEFL